MRYILFVAVLLFGHTLFAQTNHEVESTRNVFTPADLTISVGDTVTWVNLEGIHNVNGNQSTYPNNPESFGNGNPAPPGWVYQYVFTQAGTYDYRCDPHIGFGMVGTVTVQASNTPSVVINEIMYNPPESGADSLEFFELYNSGPGDVNLNGWTVSSGVELTFGDVTIAEGAYLIVAKNEAAFTATMNYDGEVIEWAGGSLSNGGEAIEIRDADNNVVDFVDFSDSNGWPAAADGDGSSLVLCDPSLDNTLASSWQAAATGTGIVVNDVEINANPGTESECSEILASINWIDDPVFVTEGGAGTIVLTVAAAAFINSTVDFNIVLGDATTATANIDYTIMEALPYNVVDGNTELSAYYLSITINDDAEIEEDEVIELILEPNNGVVFGNAELLITILDDDADNFITPIADINGVDAEGVATAVGTVHTIQGVVHCLDFDGNEGYQFFVVEPNTNDGLFVYSGADVDDYAVTEGDEVQITGELAQFAGLLEIVPSQISVLSSGNALVNPEPATTLSESLENRYVTLELATTTPSTDFFVTAGGGYNVTAVTAALDTVTIRVEFDTNIDSTFIADFFATNAATGIAITGMVSQRDFSAPFDDFYQLYPCSQTDFSFIESVKEPLWAADLKFYPNPVADQLTVVLPVQAEEYRLVDGLGRVARQGAITTDVLQIGVNDLANGVYYLQILSNDELVTRPIVKQ